MKNEKRQDAPSCSFHNLTGHNGVFGNDFLLPTLCGRLRRKAHVYK